MIDSKFWSYFRFCLDTSENSALQHLFKYISENSFGFVIPIERSILLGLMSCNAIKQRVLEELLVIERIVSLFLKFYKDESVWSKYGYYFFSKPIDRTELWNLFSDKLEGKGSNLFSLYENNEFAFTYFNYLDVMGEKVYLLEQYTEAELKDIFIKCVEKAIKYAIEGNCVLCKKPLHDRDFITRLRIFFEQASQSRLIDEDKNGTVIVSDLLVWLRFKKKEKTLDLSFDRGAPKSFMDNLYSELRDFVREGVISKVYLCSNHSSDNLTREKQDLLLKTIFENGTLISSKLN